MNLNPNAIEEMFNALATIALSSHTATVLKAVDPMAYAQVLQAIEAAETPEIVVTVSKTDGEYGLYNYEVVADFRTPTSSDRANYLMSSEIIANYPGEDNVITDPELSQFYAYVQSLDEVAPLVKFMEGVTTWSDAPYKVTVKYDPSVV